MAQFSVTKNPDGTFKLVVTRVVQQQEEHNVGSIEEVNAKVTEVANAETPQA